jgi:hypothetical protein
VEGLYRSLGVLLEGGATILLVEQDLSRALRVATRIACLLEGRVVLEAVPGEVSREDVDRGFSESAQEPDDSNRGQTPPPLPPAGPARARATLIEPPGHPTRNGSAKLELACPPEWASKMKARCAGAAKLTGARGKRSYRIAAGEEETVRLPLRPRFLAKLERRGEAEVEARLRNRDRAGGAVSVLEFGLEPR